LVVVVVQEEEEEEERKADKGHYRGSSRRNRS